MPLHACMRKSVGTSGELVSVLALACTGWDRCMHGMEGGAVVAPPVVAEAWQGCGPPTGAEA